MTFAVLSLVEQFIGDGFVDEATIRNRAEVAIAGGSFTEEVKEALAESLSLLSYAEEVKKDLTESFARARGMD